MEKSTKIKKLKFLNASEQTAVTTSLPAQFSAP